MALEGVTHTLGREGASKNVLVNTVRPGVIDTDFHRKFPKDMSRRTAMIPMQRLGRPEEVADLVFYLGSENNTFITNDTITIAGGE
jgi:NAD(P)-dependent dehydrogenase (short-subunit alcohol dehydrogenase family)